MRERLGGLHSARCVLLSFDFAEIEALQANSRWDEVGALLARAGQQVEAAGVDLLVLCTNTTHKVAAQNRGSDRHSPATPGRYHRRRRTRRGTGRGRHAGDRIHHGAGLLPRLASHGLTVLVPEPDDLEVVHTVIYDELCRGIVTEKFRGVYFAVIDRLVARGAQGVVLGCTEIELLITQDDSPAPVFPTTHLHVQAAVDQALSPA